MMVFYANQVITAWRITTADIVSASGKGLIKLFPTATPEEIVRDQGKGIEGFTKRKVIDVTEEYLARHLSLMSEPKVEVSPEWWGRLPWLPFRITVDVESPGEVAD